MLYRNILVIYLLCNTTLPAAQPPRMMPSDRQSESYTTQIDSLKKLARTLRNDLKLEEALDVYSQARDLASSAGNRLEVGKLYNSIGIVYKSLDRYNEALESYDQALKIFVRQKYTRGMAQCYNNRGVLYRKLQIYDKALESYQKALSINENHGFKLSEARSLNNIGNLFREIGDYDKALDYHHRALALKKTQDDSLSLARSLNNIGIVHENRDELDEALNYYEASLRLKEAGGDLQGVAHTLNNIGKVYRSRGDDSKAVLYYQKALDSKKKLGSSREVALAHNNLGSIYIDLGQLDRAAKHLRQAEVICRKNDFLELLKNNSYLFSKLEVDRGNYRVAYQAYREYSTLKDSLAALQNETELHKLDVLYNFEKREQELAEREASRIARIRGAAILSVLVLLMIIMVLYTRYHERKAAHQKLLQAHEALEEKSRALEISEASIRKNLEEKKTLLKEIHHRVKNNLTVVNSLLNLQAKRIHSYEDAVEAFKRSQDRVHTMAMVHDQLYKSDNLSEIGMKAYIEKLTAQLMKLYHLDKDIHFDVAVCDVQLEINRAIPCGLILNELITNALKHAFNGQKEGLLEITFCETADWHYELTVKDNGPGLPGSLNLEESRSLGLKLIPILIEQLDGTMRIENNQGLRYHIRFPVEAA